MESHMYPLPRLKPVTVTVAAALSGENAGLISTIEGTMRISK
jgi:hypothetical protein